MKNVSSGTVPGCGMDPAYLLLPTGTKSITTGLPEAMTRFNSFVETKKKKQDKKPLKAKELLPKTNLPAEDKQIDNK